tara:strand:+ start:72 stop:383 length:312 start_codon:yes stop_codon:yes gene_type:complete
MSKLEVGQTIKRVSHFSSWFPKGFKTQVLEGDEIEDLGGSICPLINHDERWQPVVTDDETRSELYKSIGDAIDSGLVTHDDVRNYLDEHCAAAESATAGSIDQ